MTDINELHGLTTQTRKILIDAGLDSRAKVVAAGEVGWLMLENFGRRRMREVLAWLGDDSPAAAREVTRCIRFLESRGYTVNKAAEHAA